MKNKKDQSPFKIPNIRAFIAFRILFSTRFYYPVFTILFLDFGLSLEQFALLNAAWAVTIVLFEVPSGALADVIGRRNLLVFASLAMVFEMGLICIVPRSNISVLFYVFLLNRILSGIAEAAASGADEALAYDSLVNEGDRQQWGTVLEKEMRYKSIAFIVAMSIGAAVYDPSFMNRVLDLLGVNIVLSQDITIRFPLYLTFGVSLLALLSTLKMKETNIIDTSICVDFKTCEQSVGSAFKLAFKAGKWVLETPAALVIIFSAMVFDHIIRMIVTFNSQYLRLIDIPEVFFGLITAGFSVIGIFIPRIAKQMAETNTPQKNLAVTAFAAVIAMFGMAMFLPFWGLVPVLILFGSFALVRFFTSYYLNDVTESNQRATVLSLKGLVLNAAYGLIGILYSLLATFERSGLLLSQPGLKDDTLQADIFKNAFAWFPWYFILAVFLLALYIRSKSKKVTIS